MNRRFVYVALAAAWGLVAISAAGCGDGSAPEAPPTTGEPTNAQQAQQAAQQAKRPARSEPTEVEMVASMEAHYDVVIVAHDALLQGDLARFTAQLALVPEQALPESAPAHWRPLHAQMQAAASQGLGAKDLDAAAIALARVVLACGTCHSALGRGPIYPAPAPDDGADPLETAMLDHKWATERLWEGVTGPWDDAWQRGADALATAEVFGDADPNLVLTDELKRRGQELRDIGEAARATSVPEERAALYGRLLATCGGCHQLIGVTPQIEN